MSLLMSNGSIEYKRDNCDFMNNLWVKVVACSFTNIEEVQAMTASSLAATYEKEVLREMS